MTTPTAGSPTVQQRALQQRGRELLAAGDAAGAMAALREAMAAGDTRVSVVHDMVRAHLAVGEADAAATLLGRLVQAAPHRADLARHHVVLLRRLQRMDDALAACVAAAERHAADLPLWRALAQMAIDMGRARLALVACRRVCDLDGDDPGAWRRLSIAARAVRDDAVLAEAVDRWHALAPHDPSARHLHAALHGASPERADPRYVAGLFDFYADRFDQHLAHLGYRTPQVIAELLTLTLDGRRVATAADLGCGTGQVGSLIRPQVGHLDGVDLSMGMLAKARARRCYDELYRADLVEFLRRRPDTYDLLVSADTLNYLGDLRPFLDMAAAALLPGGLLVASLEEPVGEAIEDYRLERTGRFSHSAEWVEGELVARGFAVGCTRTVLRRDGGADVPGLLFVAGREQPGIFPMPATAPADHNAGITYEEDSQ